METSNQALAKIKQYCTYQERCHAEVREKLYSFQLHKKEVEEIIALLIQDNYVNEERFAVHYAGGKFRMKQWGRIKIKYALKQKQVSEYSIKKALATIPEKDYNETLEKEAIQKLSTLKSERNIFSRKKKLFDYLLQKGFESNLINEVTERIMT